MSRHQITRAVAVAVAAGAVLAPVATAGAAGPARADSAATEQRQDLFTTPDQRDRAEGRRIVASTPVKVVVLRQVPRHGFDETDAGIGAAAMLGVVLLGAGGVRLLARRRREPTDLLAA